ncbi:MAG: glutathione peroxidase [Phycisphaerae bacterium]|nr:glutathione peroxidase [Phycisphaerae bacterium]
MCFGLFSCFSSPSPDSTKTDKTEDNTTPNSIYDFTMDDIDGKPVPLSKYKGQAILIVNVASKCGYTKQYAPLQELYAKYKSKGLVVLGFPANNYGGQEPGTNEEIQQFCTNNFAVDFPMFAKLSARGKDIHPMYKYLTSLDIKGQTGAIKWNFNKFLIDRKGNPVGRYESKVAPDNDDFLKDLEIALKK